MYSNRMTGWGGQLREDLEFYECELYNAKTALKESIQENIYLKQEL